MVETLTNLQHVYAKWEKNNPYKSDSLSHYDNHLPNQSLPGRMSQNQSLPGRMSQNQYDTMITSGRTAWKTRYKATNQQLPVRRQKGPRSRGPEGIPALSMTEVIKSNLATFKSSPIDHPAPRVRPFTGRCCSCLPASRSMFYSEDIPDRGLQNILQVATQQADKGWFCRTFDQYSHVMALNMSYKYPNVSLPVLNSPGLSDAINISVKESLVGVDDGSKNAALSAKQQKKVEGRARYIIRRMKAAISNRLLRFTAWFLHKLLSRLLSSIIVHKGQIEMVKKACQKNIPVMFLPTHRSHLDYILITFLLVNFDLKAPHVAAGDNLLIPLFGALMRGLGGYFIRRKLDKSGKKDHVYRSILQIYMEELLRRNQNFEFFVEGGRTRSGKALYPKGGLLSVIVDAYNENVIPDAYIVPIGISYDRLLDGNFCREQMGERKLHETFWRACISIWRVIRSHYGSVRVDFAQPFSLKEYIEESQKFQDTRYDHQHYESSPGSESPTTPDSMMKVSASEGSLYGTDIVIEGQRKLIQGLAEHIVYASVAVQTLMSTQLLAMLLLSKHRQGCNLSVLVEDFDWLKQEIISRGRDLGFSGKTPDVLQHALALLGDKLVQQKHIGAAEKKSNKTESSNHKSSTVKDVSDVFIKPTTSLPDIFELHYYANVSNSPFVLESAIANALFSLIPHDKWLGIDSHEPMIVSQQKLLEAAAKICLYLRYEYIFCPPCKTIEQALMDAFDRFTAAEILQREEVEDGFDDTKEREFARRLDKTLSFAVDEEDSEEEWDMQEIYYVVNQKDGYCMARLGFLRSVLAPLLETYYVTSCNLVSLLKEDATENDFCHRVHEQLKERVATGVASYAESASLDTLKNAIRVFQHNRVVNCYQVASIRMLGLRHRYQQEAQLHRLIETFEAYRQ